MINIFYLLIVFPLAWEFTVLFNLNGDALKAKELTKVLNEKEIDPNKVSQKAAVFIILQFCYILWTALGMFTFQWPWFLFLIGLGYIVPKNKAFKIDAILSILLLIFLAVNHFIYKFDIIKLL